VYDVAASPVAEAGQITSKKLPLWPSREVIVGAPGTSGRVAVLAGLAGPTPRALTAATVTV
jgi:hypothetical protein